MAPTATEIAGRLEEQGYGTRTWYGDDRERVYVTRQLSRRRQEMGYIEIYEGNVNLNGLTRQRARVRDVAGL